MNRKHRKKINSEKVIGTVSILVIVLYFFAHTIMQSIKVNYNVKAQKLEANVAQLRAENAGLDKERQQLVDITRVTEIATQAGLEYQPSRSYTLRLDSSN